MRMLLESRDRRNKATKLSREVREQEVGRSVGGAGGPWEGLNQVIRGTVAASSTVYFKCPPPILELYGFSGTNTLQLDAEQRTFCARRTLSNVTSLITKGHAFKRKHYLFSVQYIIIHVHVC